MGWNWRENCRERIKRLRVFRCSRRMREQRSRQLPGVKRLWRWCDHWPRKENKTCTAFTDCGKNPVQAQFEHITFEILIREFWPGTIEMKTSHLCHNVPYKMYISRCQHQFVCLFVFRDCWPLGSWDKLSCKRVQSDCDKVSFYCFYFALCASWEAGHGNSLPVIT